ncbi:MAG: hypothetical protein ABIY56_05955 [Dokdonella sp.]
MRLIGMSVVTIVSLLFATSAALATTACSQVKVVVDLRADPAKPAAQVSTEERQRLAEDVFPGAAGAFSVNSVAQGAFTGPGLRETLYLLQRGGPDASAPAAQDAVVALYAEQRLLHTFTTRLGNFIEATLPVAGDVDRVILRSDNFQMGTASTALAVLQFSGGALHEEATFPGARIDRCGDERFGGDVEALVLSACTGATPRSGLFSTARYQAQCEDGRAPQPSAFRVMKADSDQSSDAAWGKP